MIAQHQAIETNAWAAEAIPGCNCARHFPGPQVRLCHWPEGRAIQGSGEAG